MDDCIYGNCFYRKLFIFIHFRKNRTNKLVTWSSAIVMSVAISGAHYAGKIATTYYVETEQMLTPHTLNTSLLYEVIISIVILYFGAMLLMFYERNLLEQLAYEHPLTNLANRHDMNRYLHQLAGKEDVGVIFIDLNQFKIINDKIGLVISYIMIKEVAKRLQQFIFEKERLF